jgi:hypothetical protein
VTRTLLFSLGVLAGSALIGVLVYLALFAFFSRLLRNSTNAENEKFSIARKYAGGAACRAIGENQKTVTASNYWMA